MLYRARRERPRRLGAAGNEAAGPSAAARRPRGYAPAAAGYRAPAARWPDATPRRETHTMTHRTTSRLLRGAAALLVTLAVAPADEVRLLDGRVLVGPVTRSGEALVVATRDGAVTVPLADVREHRTDEQLRQALADAARAAGDTPFAHLQLAQRAHAAGLLPEAWRHLDRVAAALPQLPADAAVHTRAVAFAAAIAEDLLPARRRDTAPGPRVAALLDAVHAATSPGRLLAIDEALARMAAADDDLRAQARRNGNARRRLCALTALQRRGEPGAQRFVLRTCVLDASDEVRAGAAALAAPALAADDLAYVATGLEHPYPKVRVRTADALAAFGRAEALPLLAAAGPKAGVGLAAAGGDVPRAHMAVVTQQAYVRDFDAEVSQAAAIADPKIGVVQSGVVLDVAVAGVFEVRTIVRSYREAIRALAGADPGDDPAAWSAFVAARPARPAAATTGRR
jgi:hypothetical protein